MIEQRIRAAGRMARIPPYLFAEIDRRVAEKRAAGVDVIALDIGDPDLATPSHVVAAAEEAMRRQQAETVLASIRNGRFARHLIGEHARDYPERRRWRAERSSRLEETEARLRAGLRGPVKSG